jgi:hypothetical protein
MPPQWTARDALLTRHLARQEILVPTGAYDVIRPDGEHALSWLFKEENDMPNLSMNPTNGTLRGTTPRNSNGNGNGNGRPSRDQAPPPSNLSTQGAFSTNLDQGEMDCDDVADLIEICVKKFADDPDQLNRFVGRISNLLAGIEHMSSGDRERGPSKHRTAQDAALPSGSGTSSFLQRFPDASRIKFAGHGRY